MKSEQVLVYKMIYLTKQASKCKGAKKAQYERKFAKINKKYLKKNPNLLEFANMAKYIVENIINT